MRNLTEYYVGEPFTDRELRVLSDLYDGEIAYLSRQVGELLGRLRESGRFEDTLIVITSDHGEHFGENGHYGHMFGLYNTTVRIPLLVRPPGPPGPGRVSERPGQLVDLFSTILAAAGLPHDGLDLLGPEGPERETIFSEYYFPTQVLREFSPDDRARGADRLAPYRRRLRAVQRDGLRFIWSSDGRHELYDLRVDPGENRNLYDASASAEPWIDAVAGALRDHGDGVELEAPLPGDAESGLEVDASTRDALRALGYVE